MEPTLIIPSSHLHNFSFNKQLHTIQDRKRYQGLLPLYNADENYDTIQPTSLHFMTKPSLISVSLEMVKSLPFRMHRLFFLFDKTVKFLSVSMGTSISSLVTLLKTFQSRQSVTSNFDILILLSAILLWYLRR